MELSGNTILITGGTSGIGLGFAEEFMKNKSKVIICGRRQDRLKEIKNRFNDIETIVCDVTVVKEREQLAD